RLIQDLPFTYLHVFTYSPRPSTPAAAMPDQVPAPVKRERNRILRELAAQKGDTFHRSLVGSRLSVVTLDAPHPAGTIGLSDNYVKVLIRDDRVPSNRMVEVVAMEAVDGLVVATWSPFGSRMWMQRIPTE